MRSKMTIEYLPVKQLREYSRNAKKHPPEQVEHIANSIKEFGFRQPLVVDAKNVLVIGHGRLMAAKLLDMVEVPCVRADDLTPEQIKALRLADNKTNESAWDFDLLDTELAELDGLFDMSDFGFDNFDDQLGYMGMLSEGSEDTDFRLNDETFNVTFSFPSDKKEKIVSYIKRMGKEFIVKGITEAALND